MHERQAVARGTPPKNRHSKAFVSGRGHVGNHRPPRLCAPREPSSPKLPPQLNCATPQAAAGSSSLRIQLWASGAHSKRTWQKGRAGLCTPAGRWQPRRRPGTWRPCRCRRSRPGTQACRPSLQGKEGRGVAGPAWWGLRPSSAGVQGVLAHVPPSSAPPPRLRMRRACCAARAIMPKHLPAPAQGAAPGRASLLPQSLYSYNTLAGSLVIKISCHCCHSAPSP